MKARAFLAAWLAACALWPVQALAQATDGFHQTLVFPVVVHSGSFTQQFHFIKGSNSLLNLKPRFYPAEGTARAALGPLTCPTLMLSASRVTVPSLPILCPGIGSGSVFGFLTIESEVAPSDWWNGLPPIFAAFSRVTNPQGNGFSVDSVPASAPSINNTVVLGVKRKAATASSPAFQTNCFVGRMPEREPGAMPTVKVNIWAYINSVTYNTTVDLAPGQFVRFLDIFAAIGVPAGDVADSDVWFQPDYFAAEKVGLLSFCTLQDNTSFGADFRIGKWADHYQHFPRDNIASRVAIANKDVFGRDFWIPAGQFSNTHLLYLRNPDSIGCSLYRIDNIPHSASYGLEMRLLDESGAVVAGGTDIVAFGPVYLGDKAKRGGRNGRYLIEVESSGLNEGLRGYALWCTTGSGSTSGLDIIQYNEPVDRF